MSETVLNISFNKNDGLVINPSELIESYLWGIPLEDINGNRISNSTIRNLILSSQKKVEQTFSIILNKTVIEESRDFVREEFNVWGYIRSMYPVFHIEDLKGYINNVCQINYPKEWLSIKKNTNVANYRNIYIIPNTGDGATMTQNSLVYNGISPHLGWFGQKFIPNYWRLKYITGWDKIPDDLLNLIAKLASCEILSILGDIIYGVGITSIQISLDGVSQNTPLSRGSQGGLFAGRIKQYMDDMNSSIETMKYIYRGITFEVL